MIASIAAFLPQKAWASGGATYLPPLQSGDTIALATPLQSVSYSTVNRLKTAIESAGFRFKDASQIGNSYHLLNDSSVADNLNLLFQDQSVKAIVFLCGNGISRILPFLNFDALWQNPKWLLGTGQTTILQFAAYRHSQLSSCFVAPSALPNAENLSILTAGTKRLYYPTRAYESIGHGFASGILLGGNLSALTELIGTPYFPNLENKILIVEDFDEETYRVDRMLTQLRLSGNLHKLSGFIFSTCTNCAAFNSAGTMRLNRILYDHFAAIGIPVGYGHVMNAEGNTLFSLGLRYEFDAASGLLTQLEAAVQSANTPIKPE